MRRISMVKMKSNRRVSLPKTGKRFDMGRIPIVKKKSNRRVRKGAELELSLAMGHLSLKAMGDDKYFFDVDGVNPTDNLIGTPNFSSHDFHPADLILGLLAACSVDDCGADDFLATRSVDDCGADDFLATRPVDFNCGVDDFLDTCLVDFDFGVNPTDNLIGTLNFSQLVLS